jgi:uncharacterized protein
MQRPYHFELSAEDPERAGRFYAQVFGWEIHKWAGSEEYYLVTTGDDKEPGIHGAIQRREGVEKVNLVVGTTDLEAVTRKIVAAGGVVVRPKVAVPGVGWCAYFKDTEDIVFGVMQEDPKAT